MQTSFSRPPPRSPSAGPSPEDAASQRGVVPGTREGADCGVEVSRRQHRQVVHRGLDRLDAQVFLGGDGAVESERRPYASA